MRVISSLYITEAAMRTLIDIPDETLERIKLRTKEQGISRAEYVRRALKTSLASDEATAQKPDINQFFGLWADRTAEDSDLPLDGLEYQLKLRSEWDREWD